MEHGQGTIRRFIQPDRALHIIEAMRVERNLETVSLIPYLIGVGDDALLLDTQHIRESQLDSGDRGRADFGGVRRKASVVGGQKLLTFCRVRKARSDRP